MSFSYLSHAYLSCSSTNTDSLEARLSRIESKLDSIGSSGNALSLSDLLMAESSAKPDGSLDFAGQSTNTAEILTPESLGDPESHDIPPMREILPTIDSYFREFNCVLPLFHQASFMKLLHEFYSSTSRRSKVAWGIISCVLALGSKVLALEAGPCEYIRRMAACM